MANVYAKVKQLIRDCDIAYTDPLSYMEHFTAVDNPEKIILLYKKGQSSTPPPVKSKSMRQVAHDDDLDQLNLTGSPLRDSCQFDSLGDSIMDELLPKKNAWTVEEEKYHCIPLSDAQFNINKILVEFMKQSTPKFWSICESSDHKTLLLSNQLNSGKNRRGILWFNGIVDFEPVNMAELQAKHNSYVVKQYGPIEGMVDSFYRLGNDATLQVSHTANGSMPQSILADGKNVAKMILHQTVSISHFQPSTRKFWIQLGILDSIKETIITYKDTKDPKSLVYKSFSSSDISDIKKDIYDILTQPIAIGITDEEDVNNAKPNINIDRIVENACKRVSVELTDQLWDLLKACPSYEALKEAIEHLFTSAAKINVVNMPSSQSRLANLIRDVSDHRIAIPRLSGSEPLELLLEIGLEKVNKDYELIFVESKLCTGEELRADKKSNLANFDLNVRKSLKSQHTINGAGGPARKTLMHKFSESMEMNDKNENIGFQNSQFNLKAVEGDLARLGRIHLILEHLLMIKVNLNLENVFNTFLDELRKPLVKFSVLKEMSSDSRNIPVTNTKILTKISNIPHQLRVFFKSRNRFKIFRNTFYFSTDPIFPPHVFECLDSNDSKLDVYYSHQYLEIENI